MLAKRFDFRTEEPRLRAFWEECGVHRFAAHQGQPIHSIDTPPPTVSGKLHMGHVYSYCQTDFIARFQRMRGRAVFYPMGFDDNGLPTEQLVERELGRRAEELEPARFRARCLALSGEAAEEYRELFQELGLSVDWTRTYRTIESVRLAQWAFVDLWAKDLVYRREAPVIWCPACATAISQADLEEIERKSAMHTIAFTLVEGGALPVATTRPELLPACVAVFVHPGDPRFSSHDRQPGGGPPGRTPGRGAGGFRRRPGQGVRRGHVLYLRGLSGRGVVARVRSGAHRSPRPPRSPDQGSWTWFCPRSTHVPRP